MTAQPSLRDDAQPDLPLVAPAAPDDDATPVEKLGLP